MIAKSVLVKLVAQDAQTVKVWNGRKPLSVGHPVRWRLEAVEGGVRLVTLPESTAGESKRTKPTERFFKDSEIQKNPSILLQAETASGSAFRMELQNVEALSSVSLENGDVGEALRIFQCKGEWSVDATPLKSEYFGQYEGKRIFSLKGVESGIYSADASILFQALTSDVELNGEIQTLGAQKRFTREEAARVVIRYQGSEWKLASFSPAANAAFTASDQSPVDSESRLFRRSFIASIAAFLFLFLLSAVVFRSEAPKVEEKVRILLTAKKKTIKGMMTAAPKGAADARDFSIGKKGSDRNAGKKGGKIAEKKAAAKSSVARVTAPVVSERSRLAQKAPKTSKEVKVASGRPKPVPVPKSELFKTFTSSEFRRASQNLVSGGVSRGNLKPSGDVVAEARSYGSGNGSRSAARSGLGSAGGVSTRGAEISGTGGGDGDGGPGSAGAGYGRGSASAVSGQGRSLVSLDTGASEVDEGLTRDQVGRVIHSHMNEIRYCYESAVLRAPGIEGRMRVDFSIGAPGAVRTADVGSATVSDRRLHDCILGRLKQWKFPKPKGGVTVAVSYPFMFKKLTR
jgi:outer membrane biosynthesis protein TonB